MRPRSDPASAVHCGNALPCQVSEAADNCRGYAGKGSGSHPRVAFWAVVRCRSGVVAAYGAPSLNGLLRCGIFLVLISQRYIHRFAYADLYHIHHNGTKEYKNSRPRADRRSHVQSICRAAFSRSLPYAHTAFKADPSSCL
jgi:hypothetical protein